MGEMHWERSHLNENKRRPTIPMQGHFCQMSIKYTISYFPRRKLCRFSFTLGHREPVSHKDRRTPGRDVLHTYGPSGLCYQTLFSTAFFPSFSFSHRRLVSTQTNSTLKTERERERGKERGRERRRERECKTWLGLVYRVRPPPKTNFCDTETGTAMVVLACLAILFFSFSYM